jgi:replicative DNA helicase
MADTVTNNPPTQTSSVNAGAAAGAKTARAQRPASALFPIDRVPPHSIEAEMAVLGSMLLSSDAVADVVKIVGKPQVELGFFYHPAHRVIFEAICDLWDGRQPVDIVTVVQKLHDRGQLEEAGGRVYVANLMNCVATAANVNHYLEIAREKFCLRRLITVCTDVVQRSFEQQEDVNALLDQTEQGIFDLNSDRDSAAAKGMKELTKQTMEVVTDLIQRKGALTGLPTGFKDLDRLTSGLQRQEMFIIAARPSMGKCLSADSEIVLSNGSVATIENVCARRNARLLSLNEDLRFSMTVPSAYVDDGIKPVFRVTTRLGRQVESTLPHPFLTLDGWRRLEHLRVGDKIAVPRIVPVFGNQAMRECEIKLLAYLIGDGSLTGVTARFTNSNQRLLSEFEEAVADFGGIRATTNTSRGTRAPTVRVASDGEEIQAERKSFGNRLKGALAARGVSARRVAHSLGVSPASVTQWTQGQCAPKPETFSRLGALLEVEPQSLSPRGAAAPSKNAQNALTRWLNELGIFGKDAHAKFIPTPIFTLPRAQLALFLNRLFATDGWATRLKSGQPQLGYCTVSERLARQLQHLLLRFGVIAALRQKRVRYQGGVRVAWQLDITEQQSIQAFISSIGIFGKENALDRVSESLTKRTQKANRDLIPVGVWGRIAAAKGNESWSSFAKRAGIRGHTNIHVGKRALSRQRLAQLAEAADDEELRHLADSEVYWDEIISIEPSGLKQVYDLTIPQSHNFVANDICVHNTALAMNIAEHVAMDYEWTDTEGKARRGAPVGVFSLEMSAQQLVMRLLCARARVNLRKLRDGFASKQEAAELASVAGQLFNAPIFVDDTAALDIFQLRTRARRMKQQYGIELFVIDYLQLLRSENRKAENRQQEVAYISAGIKALAKELNVPVIVLSQLNRMPDQREGGKPRLSDLRESGALEQDADVVALLVRDDKYVEDDKKEQERGKATLRIEKQRNGPTGNVKLTFQDEITRFVDRAPDSVEEREDAQ